MGIRFACHACQKQLNIKDELAGKRGKCPRCGARFRIPHEDREFSLRIEEPTSGEPRDSRGNSPGREEEGEQESDSGSFAAEEAPEVPSAPTSTPPSEVPPEVPPAPTSAVPSAVPSATSAPEAITPQPATPQPLAPPPPAEVEPRFDPLADPLAQWYVRPATGGQYGPADGPTLRQWVSEQRLAANTLLWRDGWAEWREAGEVLPEIAAQNGDAAKPGPPSIAPIAPSTPPPTAPSLARKNEPAAAEDVPRHSPTARQRTAAHTTLASKSAALSPQATAPTPAPGELSPASMAETYLGARNRRKQRRRIALIGVLVAVSLLLILALVAAITMGP